ncbi:MAG TPA: hypothetical protein PLD59_08320 [Tepidisphaeraceae bacterium]|nr:hypothetical protein [Tepidisphaeraceae bacterium]
MQSTRGFSRRSTRTNSILAAAVTGFSILGLAPKADAINIVLTYDAAGSVEPAGDPVGASLTAIMQHIESFYEDVFEDTHTLNITYRYGAQAGGTLAAHTLNTQGGVPHRETAGTIVFSNTVNWFWDATPADNSEYNMAQTLWRDLSAAQRNDLYNNDNLLNVPATFEAGFTGTGNGSNANTSGRTDMVSVAFHEVGHALGMSAANTETDAETLGDNDYDFHPANVFGIALAAEIADGANNAHLDGSGPALMNPSIGTNVRRLPSHTDLFSMAQVHEYLQLDVPRREFYGGSNWNTTGNWSGNEDPGIFDEAFVRGSGPNGEIRTAGLSASGFADTLHVLEGSNVRTNAFSLTIASTLNLDGIDTDMFVDAGGTLSASGATININNDAELSMLGGVVSSVGTINNNAEIIGQGTINVSGRLNNSGSINVSGGTLVITATGAGQLNLDGNGTSPLFVEPGRVFVTAADTDLVVNGPLSDAFNGIMTIGSSNSVTMNTAWTLGGSGSAGTIIFLGSDGVLNLNGGTTSLTAAVLTGATVTVAGDINVGAANYGLINAPIIFENTPGGGAEVLVNGTLELSNTAVYRGGSHTGSGRLIWDGNVTVEGDTTIDVASLDLDGFVPLATLQVNNNVSLTVNSAITDAPSGTINLLGSLLVNGGNWTNDTGTIILSTGTIGGSSSFTNLATLNVLGGDSQITTVSSFGTSSNNTIAGVLHLAGNATIAGGTWSGAGILSLDDQTTTFTGNTLLNVDLDMDGLINGTGTVIINSGVAVTANAGITDIFNATLRANSGSLIVNSAPWSNSGTVNLVGTTAGVAAAISGQAFTNNATGRINISGGTNNPGFSDGSGDGGSNGAGPEGGVGGGRIASASFTNNGTITVAANSFGAIAGNITMNASGNVSIAAGGELSLQGSTTYNGGTYTGPGTLTQDTGAMVVAANTTIGVATYDWDGGDVGGFSTTTVNSGVTFTINSNVIEDDPSAYESTVTINSGTLAVNTLAAWPLAGTLNLVDTGPGDSVLAGQPVQLVTGGQINVTSGAQLPAGISVNNGVLNTISSVAVVSGPYTSAASGALTKTGAAQVNFNGPQSHGPGSSLTILGGTVVMNSDAGAGGQNLTVTHGGTSFFMGTTQHLARLILNPGSTATLAGAGNDNVLDTNVLTIAGGAVPTATLNITDENMIVDYSGVSPFATIRAQIIAGYNGGAWNGLGIRSSNAAFNLSFGVGYAEATQLGSPASFFGESIDTTSVLVAYTLYGDADLNRMVNLDDFTRLAANFGLASTWATGDFTYDGVTNLNDFTALAANFGLVLPAELSRSAVPEPSSLLVFAAPAMLAVRRRRKTHSA